PAQLTGLNPGPRVPPPAAAKLDVGAHVHTQPGERQRYLLPGGGSILYVNQNTAVRLDAARHLRLTSGEVFVEDSPDDAGAEIQLTVQTGQQEVISHNAKFAVTASAAGTGVLVAQGKAWVSGLQNVGL